MSIIRHHAEWLALLDISGPFLSLRVLAQTFPQGLDAPHAELTSELRLAYAEWLDNAASVRTDPALHRAWVRWVLQRVLEFPASMLIARPASGDWVADANLAGPLLAHVAEYGERLEPDLVIAAPATAPTARQPRMLVQIVPPGQNLEKPLPRATWQASPATRMLTLLRATRVRLGLLTNGERWMLVDRSTDEALATGFASWYARLWLDEPLTLRAWRTLLGAQRLFGVTDDQTLEALLGQSSNENQEITDQLGNQVRRAVELLVQALDLADQNMGRSLLREVANHQIYEAALTVMMRLVFLLFAEEQNLLLLGDDVYDQNYAVSTLMTTLRTAADQWGEEVLERRYDAWMRLLATFRAVYHGFQHDRLTMPAYGGRLFDPERFPFLEGRRAAQVPTPGTPLPRLINNRVVLHLLEALQMLEVRVRDGAPTEARRLSFRALDIEQIGHVYEGLLDHTAERASEPVLGLAGPHQPEVRLSQLEALATTPERLLAGLIEITGRSQAALAKDQALPLERAKLGWLRAACGNDDRLFERVLPFARLIRNDDYGRPVVILAGSVYVTSGSERRATGTHYTPRALTEPIVQHTLEPLVYTGPAEGQPKPEWRLRPANELLQLKICDLAMGSGAFLVQACRYLSDRLLEAWALAEQAAAQTRPVLIDVDGALTNNPDVAIPGDADERLVFARRLVADRCLYGVDKNPLAVDMARLSLWLITLAKGRPFSFLDHALRSGDSLLGISHVDQLLNWSLRAEPGMPVQHSMIKNQVEVALEVALRERRKIATTTVRDVRDANLKAGWLSSADAALALVRLGADLLIAAELAPNKNTRDALLIDWLARYSLLLSAAEDTRAGRFASSGQTDAANQAALNALRTEADNVLGGRRPFHWPLEFPEVFAPAERPLADLLAAAQAGSLPTHPSTPGFSALVGNPPFQGGQKITGTLGVPYRDYLVAHLAAGQRGSADLCAYFFLRASSVVQAQGQFGLIATNTIAQGDTREVGLDQLTKAGFVIPRAVPSRPWPGLAAVEVAHVWLRRGNWPGPFLLNDTPVAAISPFLSVPGATNGNPYRLKANEGKSFQGSIVLGMGFVLEPAAAQRLIERDPRNAEVLFPYLNGEDLNSRPDQSPSRWVINFHDWPLERAESYPEIMQIVREKVKPERDRLAQGDATAKDRARRWWQFARQTMKLYATIAGMERVLFHGFTSKYTCFGFYKPNIVFGGPHNVIATSRFTDFGLLQSSLHYHWVLEYGSTHETRIRYASSDLVGTFPFCNLTTNLEILAEEYYKHRQNVALTFMLGFTDVYNRFHNQQESSAEIAELRRLHRDMDQAVAVAYGWHDLDLGHGFHSTKQGQRYTICEAARRSVQDRLLALNHQRYAAELAAGLHEKGAGKRKPSQTSHSPASDSIQESMF